MKSDLDNLMEAQGIDYLLVLGDAQHNPEMVYFVGNAHVSDAIMIKKRNDKSFLFFNPMEREEAAKSGLELVSLAKYPMKDMIQEAGGDSYLAFILRLQKMFLELGISKGKVGIYGKSDVGMYYTAISRLQELMPELKFQGFITDEILMAAMMTKDSTEIERIRQMGKITVEVVGKTADFLTGHFAKNEVLLHKDDTPVTIGEVKSLINLWLAERGVENPEGTIFAIGRDAGIPHSVGTLSDPIRLGQTIVYDIYPCEAGGGYFYDFTRTWSLGYATDEVQELYDQVKKTYDILYKELELNAPFGRYQARTCELFEAMGHQTVRTNPATEQGYVHSLGHGIGLRVHEKPFSSITNPSPNDNLVPGAVFTLEPGLYYPDRGMGVRIEDSLYVTPTGKFEILAEYSKELVLPVKR